MNSRFFYHAFGVGLGGRITRPCCELIEAQAATALPSVGGYASSHVDGYRLRDIVSVRSARTYLVGSRGDDGSYDTSVTVSVEGLNILDVVTADSITARLTSRHSGKSGEEPRLSAIGTEFRGLRVKGELVDVTVQDADLHFAELTPTEFNTLAAAKAKTQASSKGGSPAFVIGKTATMCSLVKADIYENRVSTVGTIFLGEVLSLGYARRLTLVRVEMGCPVAGGVEAASGEINGTTYP